MELYPFRQAKQVKKDSVGKILDSNLLICMKIVLSLKLHVCLLDCKQFRTMSSIDNLLLAIIDMIAK